ncbi:MAG TPA: hypothetical protein VGK99_03245 [Acidobacteriota bacterium]
MAKPMLPEERFERIEQKVEFLVQEGARIDQRIAAHQGQIGDLGAFLLRLGHALENLARNTAEGFRETRDQFRVTDERFRATDERLRATDERLRATDERLRATDERLNILIGIVERKFSG